MCDWQYVMHISAVSIFPRIIYMRGVPYKCCIKNAQAFVAQGRQCPGELNFLMDSMFRRARPAVPGRLMLSDGLEFCRCSGEPDRQCRGGSYFLMGSR